MYIGDFFRGVELAQCRARCLLGPENEEVKRVDRIMASFAIAYLTVEYLPLGIHKWEVGIVVMGTAYVFFANFTEISEFVMSFFYDAEPQTSET